MSIGAIPYLLVYGTETVIPVEVEIPSLRIIQEAKLSNCERVSKRIDRLNLIDQKRMVVVSHGQLYRPRMIHALHKRVRAIIFEIGQLVLQHIFLIKMSTKENFHQIVKDLTCFVTYFLEVLWSYRTWIARHGQNRSTQMLSKDTKCEAQFVFLSFPCKHSFFACIFFL